MNTTQTAAAVSVQRGSSSGINVAALTSLRPDLLHFARMQVSDRALAEDLVQESIEVALKKLSTFSGNSSLKTWVFAILRNRVVDHYRRSARLVNFSSLAHESEDLEDYLSSLFSENGGWLPGSVPAAWPSPDDALETSRLYAAIDAALKSLPQQARRVFLMREVLGFEADEVALQVGITTTNCHVILHRARTKLRAQLGAFWAREHAPRNSSIEVSEIASPA